MRFFLNRRNVGRLQRTAQAFSRSLLTIAVVLAWSQMPVVRAEEPLKVGIIGLDTSHAVTFTQLLNDPTHPNHVPGAVVTVAYKGGSPGLAESSTRIERFTKDVTEKWHVRLVPSIPELCTQVDAVLLLSVDARQHLEQLQPVFAAKKRVYVDKPLAQSLKVAQQIVQASREAGVAFFSSSSQRYSKPITNLSQDQTIGRVNGAFTFGPMTIESYLPDLFWYGIHSVESLYALMGTGCERVTRLHTEGEDSVVGLWKDGRIGEIRGLRSSPRTYGAVVFGSKRVAVSNNLLEGQSRNGSTVAGYQPLVEEIVKFFRTGAVPVQPDETLEILAFMEAADRSKEQNGAPVTLSSILDAAR
jgi:predicted dehydrogenase